MKNPRKHSEEEINRILHAMDGMERARPKPFLYTRIKARLEEPAYKSDEVFILSPVFQRAALIVIMLVILFNIYAVTRYFSGYTPVENLSTSEQLFIEEYYPSTPTLYNINQIDSNP